MSVSVESVRGLAAGWLLAEREDFAGAVPPSLLRQVLGCAQTAGGPLGDGADG